MPFKFWDWNTVYIIITWCLKTDYKTHSKTKASLKEKKKIETLEKKIEK